MEFNQNSDSSINRSISYDEPISFSSSRYSSPLSEEEENITLKSNGSASNNPTKQSQTPEQIAETRARKEALRTALAELEAKAPREVKESNYPPRLEQTMRKDQTPRRPANAFLIFSRWKRDNLNADDLSMGPKDVSRMLGEEWKALDEKVKDYWRAHSELLRKEFDATFPWYKFSRTTKKMKADKKKKEDADRMVKVAEMRKSDIWQQAFGWKENEDGTREIDSDLEEEHDSAPPPIKKNVPKPKIPSSKGKKGKELSVSAKDDYEEEVPRERYRKLERPTSRSVAERNLIFGGSISRPSSSQSQRSVSSYNSLPSHHHHEPSNFNYPPPTQSNSNHGNSYQHYPVYRDEHLLPSPQHSYSHSPQPQPQPQPQHHNLHSLPLPHLHQHHSYSAPVSSSHSPSFHSSSTAYSIVTPRYEASPNSHDYTDYPSPPTPAPVEPFQPSSSSNFRDQKNYHQPIPYLSQNSYVDNRQSNYHQTPPVLPPAPTFAYDQNHENLGSNSQSSTNDSNRFPNMINGSVNPFEMTRHISRLVHVEENNVKDWQSEYNDNHYSHGAFHSYSSPSNGESNTQYSHSVDASHSQNLANILNTDNSSSNLTDLAV